MSEHPDSALVRRGYAAFSVGDMEALASLMTVDCVHHVPGSHPLSGHFKGRDNVLGTLYAGMAEQTDGTMSVDLEQVMADGRGHVISVHRFRAQRQGRSIDENGALFFTIVGDKISDIDECVADIDKSNEFWS